MNRVLLSREAGFISVVGNWWEIFYAWKYTGACGNDGAMTRNSA